MSGSEVEAPRQTTVQARTVQLAESKDRAQQTATIAMSVVHVAYLRSIVVAGPDANRFYTAVLYLVIVSLALQVAAGLLALAISQMKAYYQTHHDDMCADIRAMCCFCCCPPRQVISQGEADQSLTNAEGCFTRCIGHSPTTPYERSVYRYTEDICKEIVTVEQEAIEAENAIPATNDTIAAYRHKVKALRDEKDTSTDNAAFTDKLNKLTDEKMAAEGLLAQHKHSKRKLDMVEKKRKALKKRLDELVQDDILKRVAFWQNSLNYMLYVIVVSNIFITGLGVGGAVGKDEGAANNSTFKSDAK